MQSVTCQNVYLSISLWFPQFKWCAVINHDLMTTVTLKTKYHPTLSYRYPKIHALASRTAPIMKRPAHRRPSAHRRLFIVASRGWSLESRDHHYDVPLIYQIQKSVLPQNNTVFTATARVVKDAADATGRDKKILAFISAPHYPAH